MENSNMKIVYTITERGERSFWNRIGVAHVNRDGSWNIKLDAVPVNGTMQVRDWTPRDDVSGSEGRARANGGSRSSDTQPIGDLPGAF